MSRLFRAVRVPVSAGDLEGVFTWLDADDAERLGDRKVSLGSHGYAQIFDDSHMVLLHRWVLRARRGDGRIGDHINGRPLDNRKVNLRFVDASASSSNVRGRASSGHRGVYPNRKGWIARGKLGGRLYNLGTYTDVEEAARVAHEWRLENLPGYTGRDIRNAVAS